LSWQVVPTVLPRLRGDPDPRKSKRVMEAILQMNRLDIARLEAAYHKKQSGARGQLRPAGA
jgi:hypothetical protein